MRSYKATLFVFLVMLLMGGCSPRMTEPFEPRDIKILMGGRFDTHYTLVELVDENLLKVTVFTSYGSSAHDFDTAFDDSVLESFVDKFGNVIGRGGMITNWVYATDERTLSQRQLNNIWRLAENVVNGGVSEEFETVSTAFLIYVWAVIDGEMYWSIYTDDINDTSLIIDYWAKDYYNKELLNLIYYLIDLSPIQIPIDIHLDISRW